MKSKISNFNGPWIIDSGASDHISYHEDWLDSLKNKIDCTSATIPNGENLDVKKVGNIYMPDKFELKDALGVPDFKCNLLSISKIVRDLNYFLTFYLDKCFV